MIVRAALDAARALASSARWGAGLPGVSHVFVRSDVVLAPYVEDNQTFMVPLINESPGLNSASKLVPAWKAAVPINETGADTSPKQAGITGTFGYEVAALLWKHVSQVAVAQDQGAAA